MIRVGATTELCHNECSRIHIFGFCSKYKILVRFLELLSPAQLLSGSIILLGKCEIRIDGQREACLSLGVDYFGLANNVYRVLMDLIALTRGRAVYTREQNGAELCLVILDLRDWDLLYVSQLSLSHSQTAKQFRDSRILN